MSRFEGDGDEPFPGAWWLYEANTQRTFSGRAGQAKLREIREALLALPEKRLISRRLADESGGVCAVGALALKRGTDAGEDRAVVVERLARKITEETVEWDSWEVDRQTLGVANELGVRQTMAIELAYINDVDPWETPVQRYERILAWVESLIMVPA